MSTFSKTFAKKKKSLNLTVFHVHQKFYPDFLLNSEISRYVATLKSITLLTVRAYLGHGRSVQCHSDPRQPQSHLASSPANTNLSSKSEGRRPQLIYNTTII